MNVSAAFPNLQQIFDLLKVSVYAQMTVLGDCHLLITRCFWLGRNRLIYC